MKYLRTFESINNDIKNRFSKSDIEEMLQEIVDDYHDVELNIRSGEFEEKDPNKKYSNNYDIVSNSKKSYVIHTDKKRKHNCYIVVLLNNREDNIDRISNILSQKAESYGIKFDIFTIIQTAGTYSKYLETTIVIYE